jgi:hypothetical protein
MLIFKFQNFKIKLYEQLVLLFEMQKKYFIYFCLENEKKLVYENYENMSLVYEN